MDICDVMWTEFRSDLSGIAYYGSTKKWKSTTELTQAQGFAHAILISDIDAGVAANDLVYTTTIETENTVFNVASTTDGLAEEISTTSYTQWKSDATFLAA